MFDDIRRIKRKYETMPPGDNIPLYGDFIEFKDEFNGATYIGEVLDHHFSSTPHDQIWNVFVDGVTISAKQSEITRVYRRKRRK